MATVLSLSGSPSATSRTARLLRHLDARLTDQGHEVIPLDVRTIPATALLGADFAHPDIVRARTLVEQAEQGPCARWGGRRGRAIAQGQRGADQKAEPERADPSEHQRLCAHGGGSVGAVGRRRRGVRRG